MGWHVPGYSSKPNLMLKMKARLGLGVDERNYNSTESPVSGNTGPLSDQQERSPEARMKLTRNYLFFYTKSHISNLISMHGL